MTERKPPGVDQASWVDRQISAAMARGEFDNIPGQGKPIEDLDKPYDEVWFTRKLHDEGFDTEAMMPASLRLRRRLERLPEHIGELRTEAEVRHAVAELNAQIEEYLRMPSGPPVAIGLVDPEQLVIEWRQRNEARVNRSEEHRTDTGLVRSRDSADKDTAGDRRPWWRRFSRPRA